MDSPNEQASKNDQCSPSPEHPNLEYFDNNIRFLELELKEEISQGKNWHSIFSPLPVFPLQIINIITRFNAVLEYFFPHIAPKSCSLNTSRTQFCLSNYAPLPGCCYPEIFPPSGNHSPLRGLKHSHCYLQIRGAAKTIPQKRQTEMFLPPGCSL